MISRRVLILVVLLMFVLVATNAFALSPDSFDDQSLGIDIYKLYQNIMGGPIGYVMMAVLVIMGIVALSKGAFWPALLPLGAAALLVKHESVVSTLGMILPQKSELFAASTELIRVCGVLLW